MALKDATAETFDTLTAQGFAVVDFLSPTCGPCKALGRTLEALAGELPIIDVVRVDIADYPELASRFLVMATPTVVFLRDGVEVERHVGVLREDELKDVIARHLYA